MKPLLKVMFLAFGLFLFMTIILIVITSFLQSSFSPANWSEDAHYTFTLLDCVCAGLSVALAFSFYETK